eukprot:339961_1
METLRAVMGHLVPSEACDNVKLCAVVKAKGVLSGVKPIFKEYKIREKSKFNTHKARKMDQTPMEDIAPLKHSSANPRTVEPKQKRRKIDPSPEQKCDNGDRLNAF